MERYLDEKSSVLSTETLHISLGGEFLNLA